MNPGFFFRFTAALLCSFLLIAQAGAQSESSVLDGPFKGSDPRVYIQNVKLVDQDATLVTAGDLEKQTVLRVTYDNRSFVTFRPVPVKARTMGELTFKARWNNVETLENNPSLEAAIDWHRLDQLEVLPGAAVEFLDADQKLITGGSFVMLLHGRWQDYLIRFQSPAKAAFIQLKLTAGRNEGQLFFAAPRLAVLDESQAGKAVVLNFRPTQAAVCGKVFGIRLDDMIRKGTQGSLQVDSGSDTRTESIVIGPPGDYLVSFQARDTGSPSSARVLFLDANDRPMGSFSLPSGDGPALFTLPDEAVSVQLRMSHKRLEEIRIEPAAR